MDLLIFGALDYSRRFNMKNDDCISRLAVARWGAKPICPFCGAERVSRNVDTARNLSTRRWKCQKCLRCFRATSGTVFHNSHVPLEKWFALLTIMLAGGRLKVLRLSRELGVNRGTISSMIARISNASPADKKLLAKLVENNAASHQSKILE